MFDITKQFSLTGKVALVTGGAYGIGYAIAKAYADAGAKIAFNCRSQAHMDKALADYKKDGIEAHGYLCDVTDETSVREMVADIEKRLGTIDILVNNAGIIKRTPMLEMETADFRQVIDIDLTAPLRTPGHPFNAFILSKTPAHRWGTPEDLMGPAVFLASDASDFVNGHILYVDGGILAYLGRNPKG